MDKNQVIDFKQTNFVDREDLKVFEYPNFNKTFDIVYAEINGRHPKNNELVNIKSDETYIVVQGEGIISLDGKKRKIKEKDVVPIKHGTRYFCKGKNLKLYCVISPPWKAETEHNV